MAGSTNFGPIWPAWVGPSSTASVRCGPNFARLGPRFVQLRLVFLISDKHRLRPSSGRQASAMSAVFGSISANFGTVSATVWPFWPSLDRIVPDLGQSRAFSTEFGTQSANYVRLRPELGQMMTNFGRARPNLARFWVHVARYLSNVGHFGRVWPRLGQISMRTHIEPNVLETSCQGPQMSVQACSRDHMCWLLAMSSREDSICQTACLPRSATLRFIISGIHEVRLRSCEFLDF